MFQMYADQYLINMLDKEKLKMFSTSFPEKSVISRITAKMLIEVEAVRFLSLIHI